jgi:hypothetical protein
MTIKFGIPKRGNFIRVTYSKESTFSDPKHTIRSGIYLDSVLKHTEKFEVNRKNQKLSEAVKELLVKCANQLPELYIMLMYDETFINVETIICYDGEGYGELRGYALNIYEPGRCVTADRQTINSAIDESFD